MKKIKNKPPLIVSQNSCFVSREFCEKACSTRFDESDFKRPRDAKRTRIREERKAVLRTRLRASETHPRIPDPRNADDRTTRVGARGVESGPQNPRTRVPKCIKHETSKKSRFFTPSDLHFYKNDFLAQKNGGFYLRFYKNEKTGPIFTSAKGQQC